MILLIDNYDSFSYNLYQLIGEVNPDIQVSRNDKITIDEIAVEVRQSAHPSALAATTGTYAYAEDGT